MSACGRKLLSLRHLERRHGGLHRKRRELPQPARQRGDSLLRALDYERYRVRLLPRYAHSADYYVRKSDSTFCISSTVSRSPLSTMPTTPILFIYYSFRGLRSAQMPLPYTGRECCRPAAGSCCGVSAHAVCGDTNRSVRAKKPTSAKDVGKSAHAQIIIR